jgi:3-hydroxyacyl-CoA dehydrogenase
VHNSPVRRIAVVGTGLIGASWAALFLSKGLDVIATDVAPDAEKRLRAVVASAWPILEQRGISTNASPDRLRFATKLEDALEGAEFVQENGPERPDLKGNLFAALDANLAPNVIIASSTSGLKMTNIQMHCKHPQRCVVGHPFNPPHLIPLVEVVSGQQTSRETVEKVMAFYRSIGQKPVELKKEMNGHVANRLQAALWQEALYLVQEGVVDIEGVDDVVSWGPGLRWGVMGPNLLFHLGGGAGGMQHFLDHLSASFSSWMAELGHLQLTPELRATIIDGVVKAANGRTTEELMAERDKAILALLAVRTRKES